MFQTLDALAQRLLAWMPAAPEAIDFQAHQAFRWHSRQTALGRLSGLEPVADWARIRLDELQHLDHQKAVLVRNTQAFVQGHPANNVLLTGARGTGKSSVVRACLDHFADQGLRLIEVDKSDLCDLEQIVRLVRQSDCRFIVFCDDLSFEPGETGYKALKTVLDGSLVNAERVLVYATSNRRHLMPEFMRDNLDSRLDEQGDLHPAEAIEEKTALADRFGLWLRFPAFPQAAYLDIVAHWMRHYGEGDSDALAAARLPALQWATEHGSRSGRTAHAFVRDWVGQQRLARGAAAQ